MLIFGLLAANWLYNHDNLIEMTPGEMFHVTMNYSSATRTLTTTVTNNHVQYGQTQVLIVPDIIDFRVTTLSISSYSDAVQPPIPGSILAHGTVSSARPTSRP